MAIEGSISVDELLQRMQDSLSFRSNKWIIKTLLQTIKESGANVSVPTNGCACECLSGYREGLIELYDGTFGLTDGVADIPDEIKAAQASLLDSVHFGFDTATEEYALYTMRVDLFTGNPEPMTDKVLKSIMAKNKVGEMKAFRVDIEYLSESDENGSVHYKLVDNRKVKIDEERVLLVPFLSVYNLMQMVKTYIGHGGILKMSQEIHGTDKVRFISNDTATIMKYSPGADVSVLKPQYFSWNAILYAPVLGAPSTTACVTKIDLFKLYSIKKVKTVQELKDHGVRIIKDPVSEMVKENAIVTAMMFLATQDQEKFYHVYESLPRREEILPGIDTEGFTSTNISMYLHSLKAGELRKVLSLLPDAKERILTVSPIVNKCELVDHEVTGSELINALSSGVCRVLLRKSDFSLSTVIGTNNKDILKAVYGEDYIKYYESFGVRVRHVLDEAEVGRPVLDALKAYGFDDVDPQDFFSRVVEKQGSMEVNIDTYRDVIFDTYGKKQRKPAETKNIMVRSINSYLSKNGAVDYYRYIDPSKVISVKLLS